MFFQRITTEGLAHHSYFFGDDRFGVVVDPRRDVDVYLDAARQQGVRITYILETHRHEDFLVGSLELSSFTGATIFHGKACPFRYGEAIKDGDEFSVGRLRVRALETPGHTDESLTFAVVDTASGDAPVIAFTGDALFVGEVGRTDLYGPEYREQMAETLFDSLYNRILALGDGVILAPAHGGGSVCGASILDRNESTLGYERHHNPRLTLKRKAFIRAKEQERLVIPRYFRCMEQGNLKGTTLGPLPSPRPLDPADFLREVENGTIVLDVRRPEAFASSHLPGAYNIWLNGVPVYAGWILPWNSPLLLVGDPETPIERIVRMLARIGYGQIQGYLKGGFEAWQNQGRPVQRTKVLEAPEVREMLNKGAILLDVRNVEEWGEGIIAGSKLITVAELEDRLAEIPRDVPVISTCSVGHRGGIGASILQRHGYNDVYNFLGGTKAWSTLGYSLLPGPQGEEISRISKVVDLPAAKNS